MYESNQLSNANFDFKTISENKTSLAFVIERYFHPKVICANPGKTCARLEDTIFFLSRNLKREELLMEESGYPDSKAHIRDHETILRNLETLRRTLVCSAYDNELVFDFANEWVVNHTKAFDELFEKFLKVRYQSFREATPL